MHSKKLKIKKILKSGLILGLFGAPQWASAEIKNQVSYGIELDALPYLSGGYYGSFWVGKQHLKVRGIAAFINIPAFAVKSGFEDKRLTAYAIVVDYFPDITQTGMWYGAGIEKWDSEIKAENESAKASFQNTVITAGAGYVWPFHKNLYLNPWFAVHGIVDSNKTITVGSKHYESDRVTGEVSLKLGFKWQ